MHFLWLYLFTVGSFALATSIQAQQNISLTFDQRLKQLKTAQGKILALWAGINLMTGGILSFTAEHWFFYFHAMNASWGLVNLGVAAFIYFHHNDIFNQPQTMLEQLSRQRHAENMLFLNIGLDVAFVVSGIALYQRGLATGIAYPELWKGFGISVAMQGIYLLIQDLIFRFLHAKNRQRMYPHWQRNLSK
ncbi:MAG: hypothetical protein AAGE93_01830 [Bacteroidota bacterium]